MRFGFIAAMVLSIYLAIEDGRKQFSYTHHWEQCVETCSGMYPTLVRTAPFTWSCGCLEAEP